MILYDIQIYEHSSWESLNYYYIYNYLPFIVNLVVATIISMSMVGVIGAIIMFYMRKRRLGVRSYR